MKATTQVIADFLEKEVFYRFDIPQRLITDNGSQFTSRIFLTIHQQKCIKTMLQSQLLGKSNHIDWSSYLHKVVMNLNTTARTSTGKSPHYIVFGKEKSQTGNEHRLLNDATSGKLPEADRKELIYEEAAEKARAAFEQNKRRYNLRATERVFKVGDTVYL